VKIKEGKKFGMELTAAEVDNSYAGMAGRMRLSAENFTKVLANGGVRPDTLKLRLKADTIWSSLVRGRFSQSLLVGDKDVESILNAKGEATQGSQAESFEYLVRQVVLVVPRGSAQSLVEQRRKEAEALRSRIQSCEDAVRYFQSMRDGTIREPLTKTSADLPQNLRELLDKTPVGQLTPPEVTKQGIEMVALCNRKPTTADTPAKREARDKLYAQKYEAKSKAYLQDVRKASMIEYR